VPSALSFFANTKGNPKKGCRCCHLRISAHLGARSSEPLCAGLSAGMINQMFFLNIIEEINIFDTEEEKSSYLVN